MHAPPPSPHLGVAVALLACRRRLPPRNSVPPPPFSPASAASLPVFRCRHRPSRLPFRIPELPPSSHPGPAALPASRQRVPRCPTRSAFVHGGLPASPSPAGSSLFSLHTRFNDQASWRSGRGYLDILEKCVSTCGITTMKLEEYALYQNEKNTVEPVFKNKSENKTAEPLRTKLKKTLKLKKTRVPLGSMDGNVCRSNTIEQEQERIKTWGVHPVRQLHFPSSSLGSNFGGGGDPIVSGGDLVVTAILVSGDGDCPNRGEVLGWTWRGDGMESVLE
ncbi:hypothetical protein PR202_gb21005 [Eleusine coracana subsp. coracana]|uniref:Uncharacterized protein n=1 Tax=Eleusine coracana subsp. coracana TaxID=191504 RepID=A0AAV5FE14_ELECO|nr:hypothetical protein PR202_gb21005 [Eleusine coracana subsp. coracana]